MGITATSQEAVRRATLRDIPIELCGLEFYGITVERYEEWQSLKSVLLMRQTKLPVLFLAMPFIDALFAADIQSLETESKLAGYTSAILYTLALALRLPDESVINQQIRVVTNKNELKGFYVAFQGERQDVFIPKEMFPQIRQTIAWQNGDDVPDESLNDDLLETEKDIAAANAGNLKFDFEDMIASVALNARLRIRDIYSMTILEFETMRHAIDRDKRYMLCGMSEASGATWKGGNPCPSWCFDRAKKGSAALVSADKFSGIHQRN